MAQAHSDHNPAKATRRAFLSAAAIPVAAASMASATASAASLADECGSGCSLVKAARDFGAVVPEWTEAARAMAERPDDAEARRRFDAVDRRHDEAKRHLLRLMRRNGCPAVVDRSGGMIYLDASPAGSHEDIDRIMPESAVVRVAPIAKVAGLA